MATVLLAYSRCECQAMLSARLNSQRYVLAGSAFRMGKREKAPAHSIGAERVRFDIGWLCPFCGRNPLRTFDSDALQRSTIPDEVPEEPEATSEKSA